MSLKTTIIKGGFYLILANVFSQILSITVNVILARLLLPKDFGLIALTTTFLGLIYIFTDIGFGSAIIFNHDADQKQLSSLYWLNFFTSLITFLIVILTSSYAAEFYSEPLLTNIILLSSLSILISPIYTIHYKIKEKKLEFKFLTLVTLASSTIGSIFAIVLAYLNFGVYSLVFQGITTTFIRMIILLITSNWHPQFFFNYRCIKKMVWYSIKFKISSSILFLDRNIDYLILGKIYQPNVLGYYAFSYNIMYTPVKKISGIFSDLLFPSFSILKNSPDSIINGYFKSIKLISIVSFPVMTIISLNADYLIPIIFGNNWTNAIPILKILCFAGAVQSISQWGSVIFPSIGKPELDIYYGITRTILTSLAIIIGSFFNLIIVSYLLLLSKFISFILLLTFIKFSINFDILNLFKQIKNSIFIILILFIFEVVISILFDNFGAYKLMYMTTIGLLLTIVFNKKILIDISRIIKNSLLSNDGS